MNFDDYKLLLKKIDEKFKEIKTNNRTFINCECECHDCCQPDLSVFFVEREHIKDFLLKNPNIVSQLRKLKKENPWKSKRCSLLNARGQCLVYEVRPVICRSHGAPVKHKTGESYSKDVCPKNFKDADLSKLEDSFFINIDTLNTLLATINRVFSETNSSFRFKLDIEELCDSAT